MHAQSGEAETVLKAMRGRVDGLIVMAPHLDDEEFATALPGGTPAILINSRVRVGGRPAIRLDNAAGARAVAEHLVAIGRRRIIHITGPLGNIDAEERATAFNQALTLHPDVQSEIVQGNFYEESGRAAVSALIAGGHRFDAIFAANDMMAIGALVALRAAGLRVPDDVAVAGFDDVPLASHLGLTTVRVRIAELGERAIQRLTQILEGGEDGGAEELHAPELVVRASSVAAVPAR
jgi:LacI family transcriptional regulator